MTRVWPFGSFFINLINVKPRMLRISELIHYKSNVNCVSSICFNHRIDNNKRKIFQ